MIKLVMLYSALFVIGVVIQATLVHTLFPSAIAPDLILILVVSLGLRYKNPRGAVGAFLLGLFADFASARFTGPNAAGAVIAFFFVTAASGHIYAERGLTAGVLTLLASLVKSGVYIGMLWYFAGVRVTGSDLWILGEEALLTALLAPFILQLASSGAGELVARRRRKERGIAAPSPVFER